MSILRTNQIQTVAGKPIVNSTGSILQVVNFAWNGTTGTTSSTYVATGLTASIIPSNSANKILILTHFYSRTDAANSHCWATIFRNTSNLATDAMGNIYGVTSGEATQSLTWLDSPATTSSTTYTVYIRSQNAGTGCNIGGNRASAITLLEVS